MGRLWDGLNASDFFLRLQLLKNCKGCGYGEGKREGVIRILPNGQQQVLIDSANNDPLFFPTGMTMGPDGALYISNFGFGPPNGQILKVEVSD
jgi:hypothetical protein